MANEEGSNYSGLYREQLQLTHSFTTDTRYQIDEVTMPGVGSLDIFIPTNPSDVPEIKFKDNPDGIIHPDAAVILLRGAARYIRNGLGRTQAKMYVTKNGFEHVKNAFVIRGEERFIVQGMVNNPGTVLVTLNLDEMTMDDTWPYVKFPNYDLV